MDEKKQVEDERSRKKEGEINSFYSGYHTKIYITFFPLNNFTYNRLVSVDEKKFKRKYIFISQICAHS